MARHRLGIRVTSGYTRAFSKPAADPGVRALRLPVPRVCFPPAFLPHPIPMLSNRVEATARRATAPPHPGERQTAPHRLQRFPPKVGEPVLQAVLSAIQGAGYPPSTRRPSLSHRSAPTPFALVFPRAGRVFSDDRFWRGAGEPGEPRPRMPAQRHGPPAAVLGMHRAFLALARHGRVMSHLDASVLIRCPLRFASGWHPGNELVLAWRRRWPR